MQSIRTAVIQLCSSTDKSANLARASDLMQQAVAQGSQLLVLPENFCFMANDGDKLQAAEDPDNGQSVLFLKSFSREHNVAIVGGSIPLKVDDPNKVSNSCLVFNPQGEQIGRYDKMHLFDIALNEKINFKESDHILPGAANIMTKIYGRKMGLTICYDIRFPELFRKYSDNGAEVIFVPAAFTVPTGKDHWEILLRARAIENQCFIVASGQWGQHSESRASYGRSMIVDPWGQILAQCPDKEGFAMAEMDFNYLTDIRKRLPALTHRKIK